MNDMMGPAVLITVGTMWLLNNFFHERGMTFVAVILIVIGGVKMLQSSASMEGHQQPYPYYAGQVPPTPPADNISQTDNRQVNNNG